MYLACNVAYANFKNVLSRNDISLDRRLKIYTMPKLCPPCSIIITAVMLLYNHVHDHLVFFAFLSFQQLSVSRVFFYPYFQFQQPSPFSFTFRTFIFWWHFSIGDISVLATFQFWQHFSLVTFFSNIQKVDNESNQNIKVLSVIASLFRLGVY